MARIQLAEESEMPDGKEDLLSAMASPEDIEEQYRHLMTSSRRNVYGAFGKSPAALEAFRALAGTLWSESELSSRQRELAILRTARELDSRYVWHQHGRIALSEGLSADEIRAVGMNALETFDDEEAALLSYVRAYLTGSVDDALHDAVAAHFDEREIVEIGMLTGVYAIICRSMDALDVDLEEGFIGWDLSNT